MPLKVQRPAAAVALANEYGTLGKLQLALDEIIVPVSLVSDLTEDPWVDYGVGGKLGQSGAGNNWKMQLWNPLLSGVACRLKIAAWSLLGIATGADAANLFRSWGEIGITGFGAGYKINYLDDLRPPVSTFGRSSTVCRTVASAGLITGESVGHIAGYARNQGPMTFETGFIITPGTGLTLEQEALNVAGGLRFEFAERPLSPEEKRQLGIS